MSMLNETRRKTKWSLNPRGNLWSSDDSKFGQKLMEKMGWEKGKGLGPDGRGMTDIITVKTKEDNKGVGYEGHDDTWIAHQDNFAAVLSQLQQVHSTSGSRANSDNEEEDVKTENLNLKSLESESKNIKKRVHYQKFTRGKDLTRYSSQDLNSILGAQAVVKKRREKKKDRKEAEEKSPECDRPSFNTSSIPDDSKDQEETSSKGGLVTINRGNIHDYFAKRMAEIKAKSTADANSTNHLEKETAGSTLIENEIPDEVKSKKKRKKRPKQECEEENHNKDKEIINVSIQENCQKEDLNNSNNVEKEEIPEKVKSKKKDKKRKRHADEEEPPKKYHKKDDNNIKETNQENDENASELNKSKILENEDVKSKKKTKKSKKQIQEEKPEKCHKKYQDEELLLEQKLKKAKTSKKQIPEEKSKDIKKSKKIEEETPKKKKQKNLEKVIPLPDELSNGVPEKVSKKKRKNENNSKENPCKRSEEDRNKERMGRKNKVEEEYGGFRIIPTQTKNQIFPGSNLFSIVGYGNH